MPILDTCGQSELFGISLATIIDSQAPNDEVLHVSSRPNYSRIVYLRPFSFFVNTGEYPLLA